MLSARVVHATDSIPSHALLKWRVKADRVTENGLPASQSMRCYVVFLPVRRVSSSDVRVRVGGRLKPFVPFLSLLHTNVQLSPPGLLTFHFGPWTFNFLFGTEEAPRLDFHFGP